MKVISSPLCSFCNLENETIEHLFWNCTFTQDFWNQLRRELTMFDFSLLTEKSVILGILSKESVLFNHILVIAKKSIYLSRCKSCTPKISDCVSLLTRSYKMERFIAIRNNKKSVHESRWLGMAQWLSIVM